VTALEPATLYLDGGCGTCRRTGRLLRALDRSRRLRITSFRTDDSFRLSGLASADLEREVHLVRDGRAFRGYEAVFQVALSLVPLWPAVPVLWLLGVSGIGPWLYGRVADGRKVAEDGWQCCASDRAAHACWHL